MRGVSLGSHTSHPVVIFSEALGHSLPFKPTCSRAKVVVMSFAGTPNLTRGYSVPTRCPGMEFFWHGVVTPCRLGPSLFARKLWPRRLNACGIGPRCVFGSRAPSLGSPPATPALGQVQVQWERYELQRSESFDLQNYMTRDQLLDHYHNNVTIVDEIIKEKTRRGSPWVRPRPETPHLLEAGGWACSCVPDSLLCRFVCVVPLRL